MRCASVLASYIFPKIQEPVAKIDVDLIDVFSVEDLLVLQDCWIGGFFERPKMERIGGRNAGLNGCMCH